LQNPFWAFLLEIQMTLKRVNEGKENGDAFVALLEILSSRFKME
jgi:hypothetical protein